MATPDIKPYNTYFGNGSTTEFSVSFPYTKQEYVKLYLKRISGTEVVVDPKDYDFISKDTIRFPSLSSQEKVLGNGEIITIERETVAESEFDFSNQKRLFPEDVMDADDLEMQILQEHARQLERSIVVSPTSRVNPEEFLGHVESIYSSVDNINKVANDLQNIDSVALNGGNINTVAGNIGSVRSVASNISNINAVNANKDNINSVNANKENIEIVANNIDRVATVAISNSAINSVAGSLSIIKSVDDNKTNIVNVYRNESNINKVSNNSSNINTVANNQSNINIVSTNIDSVNNCSTNMSAIKDAPNQANRAKQYADQAQAVTEGTLNETQITNCITEIPQDIKLELNNGTLTLKAGSKVYVPNGSGVFNTVTTTADISFSSLGSASGSSFVYLINNNAFAVSLESQTTSGTTIPETGCLYNTGTNKIEHYQSGSFVRNTSFPIARITRTAGAITSIDQVFNGFGYIGSTVFALPGVKGLIPNGRNADGTLKNNQFNITSVKTVNCSSSGNRILAIVGNGNLYDIAPTTWTYDEQMNKFVNSSGATSWHCVCANFITSSGVITSFQPKNTFHAVDYYDFKRLDGEAVKVTGEQTISGLKTINTGKGNSLQIKSYNIDNTVIPTSTQYSNYIDNLDKNGVLLSRIYTAKDTSGSNIIALQAWDGSTNYSITADSKGWATAPTPSSATDSSKKIATTEWVANHRCKTKATTTSTASVNAPAYIIENYYDSSTGDWYRVWSDGWIEQGGLANDGVENTITFLKPFSNTNYTANFTSISHTGQLYALAFERISATQMEIHAYSGAEDFPRVWVARGY